jgi:UDP-glucose 4-epimerase
MNASNRLCADPEAVLAVFSGKRVLVTGATGFVGSNLVRLLCDVECDIVRVARRPAPRIDGCPARFIDLAGDIRDAGIWPRALEGVDVVFHFAAQTSVAAAHADPDADRAANVLPLLHLLDACRRAGARPTVLSAGTVTQAGVPARLPVDENHPDQPATTYDAHKLMAENHLKYHASEGLVRGASLRLANVYGPGPSGQPDRGILNTMIRKALAGETLTIYGSGEFLRDYLYVRDAALAFLAAATRIEALNAGHWVVGTGRGHTLVDAFHLVARRAARRTGRLVGVEHVQAPAPLSAIDARSFVADPSAFARATGWRARCALAGGIDRTIDSFLCES